MGSARKITPFEIHRMRKLVIGSGLQTRSETTDWKGCWEFRSAQISTVLPCFPELSTNQIWIFHLIPWVYPVVILITGREFRSILSCWQLPNLKSVSTLWLNPLQGRRDSTWYPWSTSAIAVFPLLGEDICQLRLGSDSDADKLHVVNLNYLVGNLKMLLVLDFNMFGALQFDCPQWISTRCTPSCPRILQSGFVGQNPHHDAIWVVLRYSASDSFAAFET